MALRRLWAWLRFPPFCSGCGRTVREIRRSPCPKCGATARTFSRKVDDQMVADDKL